MELRLKSLPKIMSYYVQGTVHCERFLALWSAVSSTTFKHRKSLKQFIPQIMLTDKNTHCNILYIHVLKRYRKTILNKNL